MTPRTEMIVAGRDLPSVEDAPTSWPRRGAPATRSTSTRSTRSSAWCTPRTSWRAARDPERQRPAHHAPAAVRARHPGGGGRPGRHEAAQDPPGGGARRVRRHGRPGDDGGPARGDRGRRSSTSTTGPSASTRQRSRRHRGPCCRARHRCRVQRAMASPSTTATTPPSAGSCSASSAACRSLGRPSRRVAGSSRSSRCPQTASSR